jgi:hypothetical protein
VAFESDILPIKLRPLCDKAGEFEFEWKGRAFWAFVTPSLRIGFNRDRNFPS